MPIVRETLRLARGHPLENTVAHGKCKGLAGNARTSIGPAVPLLALALAALFFQRCALAHISAARRGCRGGVYCMLRGARLCLLDTPVPTTV